MIVCSCNVISDHALRDAAGHVVRDPCARLTPGTVFRRVGCRPRCGGCFPLVKAIMAAAHGAHASLPACAMEAGGCMDEAEMPAVEPAMMAADELGLAVA